jgi:hypothetical protein
MQTALLGLAAIPLDVLLQFAEQRRYRKAEAPRLPLIFICGAPRTGTTLAEQVLINNLPVAFINNLTAVFPRSPLTANLIFRPRVPSQGVAYRSYYGKTVGFGGPNDGLHLWDRWLGPDRTTIRSSLTPAEQEGMRRFFGAMQAITGRSIVAKNNALNACASLVSEVFARAYFICMERDPVYLAQSQLQARRDIQGREDVPYGLTGAAGSPSSSADPIEDACRQVFFHHTIAREQQRRIGAERFWLVRYETFCQDPSALVDDVASRILGHPPTAPDGRLPAFAVSNKARIEPERLQRIASTLARLGLASPESSGATAG